MDGAEITQAIQCLNNSGCSDNSVALYTGKATLVRAYVRIFAGPASLSNISGAICLGDTGEAGCSEPLRPIGPITIFKMEDAVSFWRRPGAAHRELKGSLNFVIPASWVSSPGPLTFTVYVNYNEENIDETVYDINNWQFISTKVTKSVPLNVVFVQLEKYLVPYDSVWDLVSYLRRAYPTGDIRVWKLPVWIAEDYAFWDGSGAGCGPGWNNLLKHLKWWTKSYPQHFYGMVHSSGVTKFDFAEGKIYGGFSGCGHRPGREAGGIVTPGSQLGGEIVAQEIGHNLNRLHSPGCAAGNPDTGSSGFLGEYGVDTLLRRGYSEADREFMGYCNSGSRWVSLYTYLSIFAPFYGFAPSYLAHPVFSPPPVNSEIEFLVGAGEVSPTGVVIQDGFYHLALAPGTRDDHSTGPYTVEIQDGTGATLFSRDLAPLELSNHHPIDSGPFFLVLPWIEGTELIVFKYQGIEIGRRGATANVPRVEFLPTTAGAFDAAGPVTMHWRGSDADGDVLQYMLEFSQDGGLTWFTVSPNLLETELTVDTSLFPGSQNAFFRVIATDGLNTAVALSPEAYVIKGSPPLVHIDAGPEPISVTEGQPVILFAMGTDLEDGPFESGRYQWSSNLDGELGSGDLFTSQSLSVGDHTITLSAVDAEGMTGRDILTVTVLAIEETDPNSQPPAGMSRLSLIGLFVATVAILAFGLNRLKRRSVK